MRVALVVPPRRLWPFMNEQDNFLLPQWLVCLAAVVRDAGFEVTVIDCLPDQIGWRSLARRLDRLRPDVVASGENHALYASEVVRLVELAKRLDDNVVTVLGGAHFTNLAERYLKAHPIDFIVRGEGEKPFLRLMEALDGRSDTEPTALDGICYLRDGEAVLNPPAALVEDLDSLPMPAYDLVPMERYGKAKLLFSPGGTTVSHSRGCSSRCAFCVWWTQMAEREQVCGVDHLRPRWRTKSVDRTMAEIEVLYGRYGKKCLLFVDPSFNLDPKFNDAFADELNRQKWDLTWFAFMRADAILRDERNGIFEKLVRSGLTHLSIGVERIEDEQIHGWNKPFYNGSSTRETFALLKRKYPNVFRQATFIIGTRTETPQSIARQLDYAKELKVDYPAFHAFTPFPGTEIWKQAQREGWLELTDFDYFDMSTPVMGSETMSRDEIEAALIELNQQYVNARWLARGLVSRNRYRRRMYLWFLQVMANVFIDSVKQRVNPFRIERYTSLIEPRWYED